jgi:hypothetical protein
VRHECPQDCSLVVGLEASGCVVQIHACEIRERELAVQVAGNYQEDVIDNFHGRTMTIAEQGNFSRS